MSNSMSCACNSKKNYTDCCAPFLEGKKKVATAEELLRSRYVAFTKKNLEYVKKTHHPSKIHEYSEKENLEWANEAEWKDFQVIQKKDGESKDDLGFIEFKVMYGMKGKDLTHHELSEFRREKGDWFFYDGKMVADGPYQRQEPKVGRNDPCSCGSGKKYKKCCG